MLFMCVYCVRLCACVHIRRILFHSFSQENLNFHEAEKREIIVKLRSQSVSPDIMCFNAFSNALFNEWIENFLTSQLSNKGSEVAHIPFFAPVQIPDVRGGTQSFGDGVKMLVHFQLIRLQLTNKQCFGWYGLKSSAQS